MQLYIQIKNCPKSSNPSLSPSQTRARQLPSFWLARPRSSTTVPPRARAPWPGPVGVAWRVLERVTRVPSGPIELISNTFGTLKHTFGRACFTVSSSSVSVNELDESLELSSSSAGLKYAWNVILVVPNIGSFFLTIFRTGSCGSSSTSSALESRSNVSLGIISLVVVGSVPFKFAFSYFPLSELRTNSYRNLYWV